MSRPLPPLPLDTCWIRKEGATAVFELQVRRIEVGEVERLAHGRWLARVGLGMTNQCENRIGR